MRKLTASGGHFTVTIPQARSVTVVTPGPKGPVESVEVRRTIALVPSVAATVTASGKARAYKAGTAIRLRAAEVPVILAAAGASILAPRFANVGPSSGPLTDDERAALDKLASWHPESVGSDSLTDAAAATL